MRRHRHRQRGCCGAQFQQKRRPTRRHETNGHISPKQKHYQQEAGQLIASPTIYSMCAHTQYAQCQSVFRSTSGNTLTVLKESPRLLGTVALRLMRAQLSPTRCCRYLATPFRPFGEPGSGVFKYGKIGK